MFRKKNSQGKQSTEDWVTFEDNGGTPTLRLSGELGFFQLLLLEEALWKFLTSYKNTSLGIDLGEVSAIADTRIISAFIQACRRAERRKIQLEFLGANSAVRSAFESVNASDISFAE